MVAALVLNRSLARAEETRPTVLEMLGGGNLEADLAGDHLEPMFEALHGVGVRFSRMNSYNWRRPDGPPTPSTMDAAMMQAWRNRITPMILLEYYGNYQTSRTPRPVHGYDRWFAAGAAVAERFMPDGAWAREHEIRGWGVTVFSAMNEPDVEQSIPRQAYHDALAGLADGVHSVNARLKVVPGGFATCNSKWDATLRGYGPAIGDLLNAGRLDGIDLHTYYHERWFPIEQGHHFSAQACFDAVKAAAGVKRDVNFYATEMNVAKVGWPKPLMGDQQAARLFLTGLWDNLGVIGNNGQRQVATTVFPWNLGETFLSSMDIYAMSLRHNPWKGDSRALALRTVARLAGNMHIRSADVTSGEITLQNDTQTLLVWHNRPGWTDHPANHVTLPRPPDATVVEVWEADGLKQWLSLERSPQITISGVPIGQTYMFLFM